MTIEQEYALNEMEEWITVPELNVPKIAKTYRHNGEMYECYDVHTEATYAQAWKRSNEAIREAVEGLRGEQG